MRIRLIIGLIAAASTTGLWSAAQANPAAIVGGVVASAVGAAISNHNQPKLASCTLYDQDGRPVQVSCPADAPGALAPPAKTIHGRRDEAVGPELAGGPPTGYAPQYGPEYGSGYRLAPQYAPNAAPAQMTYLSGGLPDARCLSCTAIAPPPPPPSRVDCGCEGAAPAHGASYGRYDGARQPRGVTSFLGGGSYSSYEESREHVSGYYEEQSGHAGGYGFGAGGFGTSGYGAGGYAAGSRYGAFGDSEGYESGYASAAGIGYSQDGGVGGYGYGGGYGFYPYGAYGYQNGGYADGYGYRARVSGRDPAGFLTWPGKR